MSGAAYLIRHAEAAAGVGGKDADRRLTDRGRASFQRLLDALGPELAVRRILTSPFLRARETAGILAAATGAPVEPSDELASGHGSGRELLALVRQAGPGAALVGHNPEVGEALAAAGGGALAVPPGTVAAVDVSGARPRVLWVRSP